MRLSWPGLSRPSRAGEHNASLIGVTGPSPVTTSRVERYQGNDPQKSAPVGPGRASLGENTSWGEDVQDVADQAAAFSP